MSDEYFDPTRSLKEAQSPDWRERPSPSSISAASGRGLGALPDVMRGQHYVRRKPMRCKMPEVQ